MLARVSSLDPYMRQGGYGQKTNVLQGFDLEEGLACTGPFPRCGQADARTDLRRLCRFTTLLHNDSEISGVATPTEGGTLPGHCLISPSSFL